MQSRFNMLGIATMGNDVCLGLGTELVTARTVEGRFPRLDQVIPKKRPLFSFRIDPKVLGETLLAVAELLPDEARAVQCFYYGDGLPLGFCAQNAETGMMIDALVVPLTLPKADPKDKATEAKPQEEPKPNGRHKKDEPNPEANGQSPPDEASPEAAVQEPPAAATAAPKEANGQDAQEPKAKKSKKAKA